MYKKKSKEILLFLFMLAVFSLSLTGVLASVNGATVSPGTPTRGAADGAGNDTGAYAGNITELTISGFAVTQSWQGYFGNVTGVIQLEDNGGKVMYNWSLASPQGEIYASVNGTGISWGNTQCFNFTSNGTFVGDTTGGVTSLAGMNLSQLESRYGIAEGDGDAVNETFTLIGTGHREFYVGSLNFTDGECRNTRVYGDTGAGVDGEFEEVLLYEPVSTSVIFTTLLDQDMQGFDQNYYDFEMLVLENGHGTDTTATTYFFYVELE